MKAEDTPLPAPPESDGGITIQNRLHPGHRYRAAMHRVFRVALRDLSGPWDVSVYPVGRTWFRISIVAPAGACWSMSVPVHVGSRAEDLTETIRAACVRYRRLRLPNGGGPKASSERGGVASVPSPAVPKGTSK